MKKRHWFAVLLCTWGIGRLTRRYMHSAGQRRYPGESRTGFLYRVTKGPLKKVRIVSQDYEDWAA